jgi:putative drug exporter of the RND superfamily
MGRLPLPRRRAPETPAPPPATGDPGAPERVASRTSAVARAQAWAVVALRWLIVPGWIAAAVWISVSNQAPTGQSSSVISLVPANAGGLRVAERAARDFKVPLETENAVVQRAPHGLSSAVQAKSIALAVQLDRAAGRQPPAARSFAVPVPNTLRLAPGSRESGTTLVTYLEYPRGTDDGVQVARDEAYANQLRKSAGHVVGVTGIVPAEWHEGALIEDAIPLVELATVLAIALLVGIKFRSVGAPLLTLATVGIANLCADQVMVWAQQRAGVGVPSFLKPLEVALILGIGTDYAVFYLTCFRAKAMRAEPRVAAARATAAEISPIVLAGGLILAAGLGSLQVARVGFFRDLGPGLALTVLTTLAVGLTFVPACLALFGRVLLWPSLPVRSAPDEHPEPVVGRARQRMAWLLTARPVAALTALALAAVLGLGVWQLHGLHVGFTEVAGLPSGAQERVAGEAVSRGFAPGMLGPTQVLVERPGVAADRAALVRFEDALARQPGVAAVAGPRELPLPVHYGVAESASGNAARFLVVLDRDPFGAPAIHQITLLQGRLRGLANASGLRGARVGLTGDTVIAQQTVAAMRADVLRIALVVLAMNVVLLGVFLRAIVAPLLLVMASALAVAATLGITTFVFADLLGYGELTYWVPYAAAVLLVSLGSDYNVFVAGRMWQEARLRPLRDAIAVAAPRAAGAVRTAGLTLAVSFALLGLVPIRGFREFAFAMTLGVALETFVVRSLLVPALIALVGYGSGWPGRALRRRPLAVDDG